MAYVKNGTLTANTVATVALGSNYRSVRIGNYGTSGIMYARLDGVDPTVGGDDCIPIPAGAERVVPYAGAGAVSVKLICASANAYTVIGA